MFSLRVTSATAFIITIGPTATTKSIRVPFLYMPSETDLYFPVGDARYEAQFMSTVKLVPIPSIWGHPAGAGANDEDRRFLNEHIGAFLAGNGG